MPDSRFAIPLVLIVLGCATATPEGMSQESLAQHIEDIAGRAAVSPNVVEFEYDDIRIACVSDATHDRMRLISPIAKLDSLQPAHLEVLLVANFHTTLDARYALSEGVIYAAFLHPLSTLIPEPCTDCAYDSNWNDTMWDWQEHQGHHAHGHHHHGC